jgi:cation diffusion facilitator CzcD-associated flavoprotein CzcO
MVQHPKDVFDVIVIGAGYTGLTAARDTSTAGQFPEADVFHWPLLRLTTTQA